MRWLFLCNLVRDVAEIQILPYNPHHQQQQQQQQPSLKQQQNVEQAVSTQVSCEEEWRDNCLRGILSYPPGQQRLLVMDAMRTELVNKLAISLRQADQTLARYEASRRRQNQRRMLDELEVSSEDGDDPYIDADMEVLKAFENENLFLENEGIGTNLSDKRQAVLVISSNSTDEDGGTSISSLLDDDYYLTPSEEQIEDAQKTTRVIRDYLPQLVSVVLRSPPAFEPQLLNPIEKLREVVLNRCIDDANWGVDMCWLLEAEVGRTWKKLFEHRQQTGRRLIVVLPAEKAAVLAKIGTEKREAFDLLQDAEQSTAYGYAMSMMEQQHPQWYQGYHPYTNYLPGQSDSRTRLPSSLSLRRCSHFGDTMHFIDRLTRISMDLRHVPLIHRRVSTMPVLVMKFHVYSLIGNNLILHLSIRHTCKIC